MQFNFLGESNLTSRNVAPLTALSEYPRSYSLKFPRSRGQGGNTDRDENSLRDHSIVDPGFAIGGVEEHMRVIDDSKAAISENGDVLVESHANTRHLGLGDTAVRTESLDEVIDLAGRDPVPISLHHHGEQRLIDPAASLEHGRRLYDHRALCPCREITSSGSHRPSHDSFSGRHRDAHQPEVALPHGTRPEPGAVGGPQLAETSELARVFPHWRARN